MNMGAQGFSRYVIEVIKNNRALLPSQNRTKSKSGEHPDGKKPLRFKKANRAGKKTILYDKKKIEQQIRFRVGLIIMTVIFITLAIVLFVSFA